MSDEKQCVVCGNALKAPATIFASAGYCRKCVSNRFIDLGSVFDEEGQFEEVVPSDRIGVWPGIIRPIRVVLLYVMPPYLLLLPFAAPPVSAAAFYFVLCITACVAAISPMVAWSHYSSLAGRKLRVEDGWLIIERPVRVAERFELAKCKWTLAPMHESYRTEPFFDRSPTVVLIRISDAHEIPCGFTYKQRLLWEAVCATGIAPQASESETARRKRIIGDALCAAYIGGWIGWGVSSLANNAWALKSIVSTCCYIGAFVGVSVVVGMKNARTAPIVAATFFGIVALYCGRAAYLAAIENGANVVVAGAIATIGGSLPAAAYWFVRQRSERSSQTGS